MIAVRRRPTRRRRRPADTCDPGTRSAGLRVKPGAGKFGLKSRGSGWRWYGLDPDGVEQRNTPGNLKLHPRGKRGWCIVWRHADRVEIMPIPVTRMLGHRKILPSVHCLKANSGPRLICFCPASGSLTVTVFQLKWPLTDPGLSWFCIDFERGVTDVNVTRTYYACAFHCPVNRRTIVIVALKAGVCKRRRGWTRAAQSAQQVLRDLIDRSPTTIEVLQTTCPIHRCCSKDQTIVAIETHRGPAFLCGWPRLIPILGNRRRRGRRNSPAFRHPLPVPGRPQ